MTEIYNVFEDAYLIIKDNGQNLIDIRVKSKRPGTNQQYMLDGIPEYIISLCYLLNIELTDLQKLSVEEVKKTLLNRYINALSMELIKINSKKDTAEKEEMISKLKEHANLKETDWEEVLKRGKNR